MRDLMSYTLVNFDEHADFFTPIISQKYLYSTSKQNIEKITYDELRISDFIVLLFERKHINHYVWVSNKNSEKEYRFNIEKSLCDKDKVLLKPIFNPNGDKIFCLTNIEFLKKMRLSKKIIVSIDLDYFFSNDIQGEKIQLEITKKEYDRYCLDQYHTLRLSYGNRCKIFKDKEKYILEISESKDLNLNPVSIFSINEKIQKICNYIEECKKNIEYIFICKSVKSGYVDSKLANYILLELKKGIKNLNDH